MVEDVKNLVKNSEHQLFRMLRGIEMLSYESLDDVTARRFESEIYYMIADLHAKALIHEDLKSIIEELINISLELRHRGVA